MKILLSHLRHHGLHDFHKSVKDHAREVKAWQDHQRKVDDDLKNDVPIEDRHAPYPPPTTHPLIASAADHGNFEIVDDSPTDEEILAGKKLELLASLTDKENKVKHSILPGGKRRLLAMKESEIFAIPEEKRSADQVKFLEEQKKIRDRFEAIDLIAAHAMHDIEDLTMENIDQWKMPTF